MIDSPFNVELIYILETNDSLIIFQLNIIDLFVWNRYIYVTIPLNWYVD